MMAGVLGSHGAEETNVSNAYFIKNDLMMLDLHTCMVYVRGSR
jgi:hypothetical protein